MTIDDPHPPAPPLEEHSRAFSARSNARKRARVGFDRPTATLQAIKETTWQPQSNLLVPVLSTYSALRTQQHGRLGHSDYGLSSTAPRSQRAKQGAALPKGPNPYLDSSLVRSKKGVPKWMRDLGVPPTSSEADNTATAAARARSAESSARTTAKSEAPAFRKRMGKIQHTYTTAVRLRPRSIPDPLPLATAASPAGSHSDSQHERPAWNASVAPDAASRPAAGQPRRGPPTSAQLSKSLARLKVVLKQGTPREHRDAVHKFLANELLLSSPVDGPVLSDLLQTLQSQKPAVQVTAAGVLLQRGLYFSAMKAVFASPTSIRVVLDETRMLLEARAADDIDLELSAEAWHWEHTDRELFLKQFSKLKITQVFRQMRGQMAAMGPQGAPAIARIEREVLLKVTYDFLTQLGDAQPGEHEQLEAASEILHQTTGAADTQRRKERLERKRRRAEAARAVRDERDVQREERHRRAEERRRELLAQSVAEKQAKHEERRQAARKKRVAEAHRRVAAYEAERQRQIERERQRIAARRQLKEAELNEIMAEMQYAEAYRAAFPDEAYPEPDHGRSPSPRSPAAQRRSQPRVPVDRRAYDLGEGAPAGPTGQRGAGALSEYTRDLAEIPPPPRDPTRSRQPQVKVMATDKERRQAELNEEMAAIKIQAHFRGHRDRKRVRKLRMLYTRDSLVIREGEVMQELRDIEEKMRVQEAIMMREAQQLEMHVEAMLQDQEADRRQQGHTDEQERAAVRIQSHYRGHKGRQRAEKLKSQYDRLKRQREAKFQELEAITAAQAPPPPRYRAASQSPPPEMKERLWTDKEIKAAMTIQANYRGHQSRVAVAELRLERAKKMAELAELELKEASAVRIQAGFRGHKARKVAKQKRDAKKHSEEEALKKAQRDKEREKLKAQQAALDVASRYIAGDTTPRKASARSQPLSPEASHTSVPSGQTSARRVGRGPSALSREDAIAEEDEEAIYDAIERAIQSAVGRSNDSLSDVLGASRSELGAEVSQLSLAETDKAAIDEVLEGAILAVEASRLSLEPSGLQMGYDQAPSPGAVRQQEEAAMRIQAGFRGMKDRERVQAMIEQRQRELEQQLLELEREEQEAQAAALRIQRSYRGHQGRKHVQAMKQEKKAALAIQKSYRGHKGRKQVEDMKRQRELQEAERKRLEQELAERRMQMAMEEDQGTGVVGSPMKDEIAKRQEEDIRRLEGEIAALKKQTSFRGWSGRRHSGRKRGGEEPIPEGEEGEDEEEEMRDEEAAAVRIQAGFRGYKDRKRARRIKQEMAKIEEEEKEAAAVTIQKRYRGHQARKRVQRRREEMARQKEEDEEEEEDELEAMRKRLARERERMQAILAEKRRALEYARQAKAAKEERRQQALIERQNSAKRAAEKEREEEEARQQMEITQRHEELERELAKQKEDAKKDSDALIARAEQLAKEGRLEQLKAEREKLQRKLDEEREALQQRLEQERAELRAKMEAEEATEKAKKQMRMQAESEMQAALNRFSQQLRTNQEQMAALLAQLSQGKSSAVSGPISDMTFSSVPVVLGKPSTPGATSLSSPTAAASGQSAAAAAGPTSQAGASGWASQARGSQAGYPSQQGYAGGRSGGGQASAGPGMGQGGGGSTGGLGPPAGLGDYGDIPEEDRPTPEEIREYAEYLGMDPEEDADLFYIAEWAIMAPVPDGWTEHMDNEGNEYYHNSATGVSTYEHPMDDQFRSYYRQVKAQMMGQSLSDSIKQQQQTVAATG